MSHGYYNLRFGQQTLVLGRSKLNSCQAYKLDDLDLSEDIRIGMPSARMVKADAFLI